MSPAYEEPAAIRFAVRIALGIALRAAAQECRQRIDVGDGRSLWRRLPFEACFGRCVPRPLAAPRACCGAPRLGCGAGCPRAGPRGWRDAHREGSRDDLEGSRVNFSMSRR